MNKESEQMRRTLKRLMEDAKAEAKATETEAASLRDKGIVIPSQRLSTILTEAASIQTEVRRLQLASVIAKIQVCKASHGPESRALAAAGSEAAELIEAAERSRVDELEKAMRLAAVIDDGTEENAEKSYQTALFYTTVFFDEVVRQATELLDAADDEAGGLWSVGTHGS
ncbi:hypothetical protein [Leifsonia sp. A12D58]|uniref:hypothetical protein n=1 Tax=Leifsonia sp. A12D58 TaxID=3397674 RepID=UPI0039DF7DEC